MRKIILIPIVIILIFLFLAITSIFVSITSPKTIRLKPGSYLDYYNRELIFNTSMYVAVKKGVETRITIIGSFSDENSPYYMTLEEFSVGEKFTIGKEIFVPENESMLYYVKFKIRKDPQITSLFIPIINYRVRVSFCDTKNIVCFDSWDRQYPSLDNKDVLERTYYAIAAVPKGSNIDLIVFSHFSFSGGLIGPSESYSYVFARYIPESNNELYRVNWGRRDLNPG